MSQHPYRRFFQTRALRQWVEEVAEAVAREPGNRTQRWCAGQSLLTLTDGHQESRSDFITFLFLKALIAHANRMEAISLSKVMASEFLVGETEGSHCFRRLLARGRTEAKARIRRASP